ncbi:uncharacterized protein SCHCODRAFT_02520963, partial [Schizophyllum commune H4-8]|uniref:uncharacterized protein n=1 Tax=Schizophyllum commune (strain H4-8 / FGSC 9210) TaxID=578458 RepID=UPI002160DF6F
ATSTAVECVFSQGYWLIDLMCNTLSISAICTFLCLGMWKQKDMLRDSDLLETIASVGKCKHAQLGTSDSA